MIPPFFWGVFARGCFAIDGAGEVTGLGSVVGAQSTTGIAVAPGSSNSKVTVVQDWCGGVPCGHRRQHKGVQVTQEFRGRVVT